MAASEQAFPAVVHASGARDDGMGAKDAADQVSSSQAPRQRRYAGMSAAQSGFGNRGRPGAGAGYWRVGVGQQGG
jgi:hypothetical protein